jgi:hypothetical protein
LAAASKAARVETSAVDLLIDLIAQRKELDLSPQGRFG